MQIGITTGFSHRTPVDFIAGTAKRVEAAGFSTLWVPEHVLFFPEYESSYPYSDDGKVPGNPNGVLEPFSVLSFVAAHTSTLRLGTGICLVPQRQPVYTAKMVADLDYLSGGRVDFGIGIGWLAEEFVALGLDFADRAARCNEYIDVMKACWGEDPVNFSGETVSISNAWFNPKPVQRPHPPIFVGGESEPALRRVARFAQGWYGFGVTPDQVEGHLARLDRHLAEVGRSRSEIKIYVSPNRVKLDPDVAAAYEAAGVDELVLGMFARDLDGVDARLAKLLARVGRG